MNPILSPATLVGRTLGGFLIQGQLGAGGMGVVYRARDERLNRTVAVKVLHPRYSADDVLRERFVREGRTAALIDHPNVVRVISAGEEDGIPYLVMEYVEGGTLDRMLERSECLSVARCLRIVKQLAEALAAAHRVGVMHRDVKPANVLFTNAGEPKLADFGLAREEAADHRLSQSGILLGTPHYMSPEACEGRQGDARSDIYSLGVLLYAMLEKRLPFEGDSQARILMAQIQDPVPPLTHAPPALKQVVFKALEKDPANRWTSASEFAVALEHVLEEIYLPASRFDGDATPVRGSGVSPSHAVSPDTVISGVAGGPGRAEPASPPLVRDRPGRRRGLLGVSTAAVVLVVAGFLAPTFLHRRELRPAPSAGETAAMPPARVPALMPSTDRDPVPPPVAPTIITDPPLVFLPVASPLVPPMIFPAPEPWEADFQRIDHTAEVLEATGEYRRALDAWAEFQPPSAKAGSASERARKRILERSATQVRQVLLTKPRGAKAAADLRALAARIPEAESLPLLAAATEADKRWAPADGLEGLRYGFSRHDLAAMVEDLDAAGPGESADERSRIDSARSAVRRFGLLLDRAFARYRAHRGTVLDIQRADGSIVHGLLQAVDEPARRIYVETDAALVNLSTADLASRELLMRAVELNPPDEVLLAALDLLLLAGKPQESWPAALRIRRRGLVIDPDRASLLQAEIPPADLQAAKSALHELGSLGGDPVRLRAASRDWLRMYRALPLDLADAANAREALRRGGGAASAEDVGLYCGGHVTGHGRSLSIDYDSPEALLADFESSSVLRVESGEAAALAPAALPVVQLLKGLSWKEGVIQMQLRTSASFTVLVGWRSPGEHFEFVLSPAGDGRVSISLPVSEKSFDAALLADGWIDLRFAWAPGKIFVRVNGVTRECPLPRDWSGEIGFAPGGAWSWRSLQVYGQADFEPPASTGELLAVPQARRAFKASWGSWGSPDPARNELSIGSGEGTEWAAPATWEAGNSYRVAFGMHVPAGAAVSFDIGVGEGRRRVNFGAGGENGFVVGGGFFRTGAAPALVPGGDIGVEIVAYRGRAWILMEGKCVWTGNLDASNAGGLAVGASGGPVILKDLKVSDLQP